MWWEIKHLLIAYFLTSNPAKMIKIDYVCQSYIASQNCELFISKHGVFLAQHQIAAI